MENQLRKSQNGKQVKGNFWKQINNCELEMAREVFK
jgi:hypothetical protein